MGDTGVKSNTLLMALVIVLVLMVIYMGYKQYYHYFSAHCDAGREDYSMPHHKTRHSAAHRAPGSGDVPPPHSEHHSAREHFYKYGGHSSPEKFANAERAAWAVSNAEESTGHYDTERGDAQSHTSQPVLDYNGMITGAIADSGMQAKHANWVGEVKPYSRTLLMVDNMDEALEQSTHRVGLTRYNLQPVAVINPLMQVEGSDLGKENKTFRFLG
jgi:hypothetical protein